MGIDGTMTSEMSIEPVPSTNLPTLEAPPSRSCCVALARCRRREEMLIEDLDEVEGEAFLAALKR